MSQRWDGWKGWKMVGGILRISYLHFLILALVLPIFFIEFMIAGKNASFLVTKAWMWVFATPVRFLDVSVIGNSLSDRQKLLLLIPNSLLYGVTWWFSWRMYKVMFQTGSKRDG